MGKKKKELKNMNQRKKLYCILTYCLLFQTHTLYAASTNLCDQFSGNWVGKIDSALCEFTIKTHITAINGSSTSCEFLMVNNIEPSQQKSITTTCDSSKEEVHGLYMALNKKITFTNGDQMTHGNYANDSISVVGDDYTFIINKQKDEQA